MVFRTTKTKCMKPQNFKNHARLVPGFHYVTLLLLLLVFIGSVVNLFNTAHEDLFSALLLTVLSFATILLAFFARGFALKAQDRAIRTEQNFRYFLVTGKPLYASLTMGQIIALRFAGDNEFIALAAKAATEKMSSKEIKMAIQDWKGDYNRV